MTFVSRGLESIRGFDLFMKVADRIARERSDVLFVVVGGEEIHYGWDKLHTGSPSFKQWVLSRGQYDLSRFVFLGRVLPEQLADILRISDLHIYLTAPFVLSWSLLNAMASGCVVLGSDVPPVREVIRPGENGLVEAAVRRRAPDRDGARGAGRPGPVRPARPGRAADDRGIVQPGGLHPAAQGLLRAGYVRSEVGQAFSLTPSVTGPIGVRPESLTYVEEPTVTDLPSLRTPRLLLRPWRDEDLAPFAALNGDPVVMEFFPSPLDRAESDAAAARIREHFAAHGYGLWAVEVPGVADFIGFVGLAVVSRFQAHFTPCVEIGWRLAREHWGRGYATEAARAALDHGFRDLAQKEIVSFTVPANLRSRAVMERIGMTRSPDDDFEHPLLPEGHPLRRHVLYRIPSSTRPSLIRRDHR